jgi:hypothetical protein
MTAGSRGEAQGGQPVFAAAAPVALAEAVRSAAAMMGWRVDAIVPAWTAWLAHAERDRSASRRPRVILAIDADAAHVLRVDDGLITGARRVPATMLEEIIAATGTGPGDAVIYADATHRGPVERSLSAVGWSIANAAAEAIGPLDSAAAGASGSRVQLVPPTLAAERRAGARGVALRIAAAAVLLLVGAAIVELWGSTRELEAVRARRAAIRAEVQPLLASRDSIERLERRAGTVRDLEAAAPRWTRALFDLALLLPRDTHITSMRTLGDTILIEATGSRAGDALQALRRAGSLEDVRMLGAIERELLDGETTSERFRLRARLNRPVEPDAVPPVTAETSAAEELGRKPMRRSM